MTYNTPIAKYKGCHQNISWIRRTHVVPCASFHNRQEIWNSGKRGVAQSHVTWETESFHAQSTRQSETPALQLQRMESKSNATAISLAVRKRTDLPRVRGGRISSEQDAGSLEATRSCGRSRWGQEFKHGGAVGQSCWVRHCCWVCCGRVTAGHRCMGPFSEISDMDLDAFIASGLFFHPEDFWSCRLAALSHIRYHFRASAALITSTASGARFF